MAENFDLIPLLDFINPASLSYQEWVNVGMSLKHEGYSVDDWDSWSQADQRYKRGECAKKWESFKEDGQSPITGATITQMAKEAGWVSEYSSNAENEYREIGWDDVIDRDYRIVDEKWVEAKEIREPANWSPVQDLIRYLETLFESTDLVGYVTATYPIETDNGTIYKPTQGNYDRTAGQLIQQLQKNSSDIGAVFGDYKEEAGAWIRFNPLDGKGVKNDNVTDLRYALVESDSLDLAKQNALLRELELPIAALVHSGNKSLHAIVRVDAKDYQEYRKRVDYIYQVCKKNGLDIDSQNRNPSRLSRLPGVTRNGAKQFLIDTNIGKSDYEEWYQFIEDLNDDLPDPESIADNWENLPDLAPELIKGVLRQGHKMLIAGPSKAGKSFALIELCIAIAEGRKWLGWDCEQGKVLYVNLELDRASALHRFKDVYTAMGLPAENISNIDIWNLRGKTVPMDKLAPKLIRRSLKKNYQAVIIDPIYKVLTGDENSADQMAHFTNQFDKVATELGCSVIYCHHHSKGSQGGKKSMDRSSGSGVFARDPDALLDLIELELTDDIIKMRTDKASCAIYQRALQERSQDYYSQHVGLDDLESRAQMQMHFEKGVKADSRAVFNQEILKATQAVKISTAWRVEGTLREFAKFAPVNMYFNYPVHNLDSSGVLADISTEEKPAWMKSKETRKKNVKEDNKQKLKEFDEAIENANFGEPPTKEDVADYLGISVRTVERRLSKNKNYFIDKNTSAILKKDKKDSDK